MKDQTPTRRSCLVALVVLFPAAIPAGHASTPSSESEDVAFCRVVHLPQESDLTPPAAKLAALEAEDPRTVRMAYFLPNDRPYRAEVVDSMKVTIRRIQTFIAEEMQSHGQGNLTFRFETDAQGEPLVHRVDGEHSDAHYLETGTGEVQLEIETALGGRRPIQLFVLDNSVNAIPWGSGMAGGVAMISQGPGRRTLGTVLVSGFFSWSIIAHELGHTFGLEHDFRDNDFIMSFGPLRRPRLSACAAELLATHPYLNPGIDLIPESSPSTISLLSPERYPAGSTSIPIRVRIGDSAGLHQVHLTLTTPAPHFAAGQPEIKACRSLSGEEEAVVEFEYDGLIPSNDLTSLSHPIVHPGVIWATDKFGWATGVGFVLLQHSDRHVATLEKAGVGTSLAFLPDGSLASASVDTVRLWDLGTRETVGEHWSWSSRPGGGGLAGRGHPGHRARWPRQAVGGGHRHPYRHTRRTAGAQQPVQVHRFLTT